MIFDILDSVDKVTVAFGEVSAEEVFDERLEVFVKSVGVPGFGVYDFLVNLHRVVINKRSVTCMHLVHKNSKCPPINCLAMALVEQNFWCNVFGGSTNGVSAFCNYFGKTVINQF